VTLPRASRGERGDDADVRSSSSMSLLARLVTAGSRFANKRGIYLGRRATKLHVVLYRLSGGRLGGHIPGMPQVRILLLDHAGAKTGVRRTSPVIFYEEEDLIAVAASQAGQPTNPGWFHNLKANPDTTIEIGSLKRHVHARVATNGEHNRLWPKLVAFYPDYDFFQRLAGNRKIPIVILGASEGGVEP
jgi:F420H(2)-dependent quinone reductase